uniref:Protein-L-isoaspartate O-methyltransferase n=1 Tax=Thermosporothrix sp. COM3 TaxID=2490863 RepID=A0A455SSN4_9CHLR|nr:hypothetical protein KTC_48400 [Thermosporothrix sp. COM3]
MDKARDQEEQQRAAALQQKLVDELVYKGLITSPRVQEAFRAIPRHLFLPHVPLEEVYRDQPIVTRMLDGKAISSSSQPAIMALMLEMLDLQPGARVLEIGAGTGYNAALMAYLVGEEGRVVSVDIDQDLVETAQEHIQAAGFPQVQVVQRDGFFGYAEAAPYDRIVLTVGSVDIAPAWYEQLKPGGKLELPLDLNGPQLAVVFEKREGYFVQCVQRPCGFMGLRGLLADTVQDVEIEPNTVSVRVDTESDISQIRRLLRKKGRDTLPSVPVSILDLYGGLFHWLMVRVPHIGFLLAKGAFLQRHRLPLQGNWGMTRERALMAPCLFDGKGFCMLVCMPAHEPGTEPDRIVIRSFGDGRNLIQLLDQQIRLWVEAGRPSIEKVFMKAYPRSEHSIGAANEVVVPRRWHQFLFRWQ